MSADPIDYLRVTEGSRAIFDSPARLTTIFPSYRINKAVEEYGISLNDFSVVKKAEPIVLRHFKENQFDLGKLINYSDTDATCSMRHEMERINEFLEGADIIFSEANVVDGDGNPIDLSRRALCRRFVGSFEGGGRLFGGFWQNMPKVCRKQLLICGEPTVTLDYGQMAIRTLYAIAEAPLPMGDPYEIPGLEGCRDGVKKVLNALTFPSKPLIRFPKDCRSLFPSYLTFKDVLGHIREWHPAISGFFFVRIGYRLQRLESDILVQVLLSLIDRGIVALPIHDAVIVPRSASEVSKHTMLAIFKDVLGCEGTVKAECY